MATLKLKSKSKLTLKSKSKSLDSETKKSTLGTLKLGRRKVIVGKKKERPLSIPTPKKAKTPKKMAKKQAPPKKIKKEQPVVESRISKQNRLTKELDKFDVWRNKQPLKVGVLADLLERFYPVFSKKIIRLVMTRQTISIPYLQNVATGDNRFNLDGEVAGEIQEKEKVYSNRKLSKKLQEETENTNLEA